MPPPRIVLFGPPASGKSTLTRHAMSLYPSNVVSFEMEGIGPDCRGLSEEEAYRVASPVQIRLFRKFDSTSYDKVFILSPAYAYPLDSPHDRWCKVFLLPGNEEQYRDAVLRRNPHEGQSYMRHYERVTREYESRRHQSNVILVSRLDPAGSEISIKETWEDIRRQLGFGWDLHDLTS